MQRNSKRWSAVLAGGAVLAAVTVASGCASANSGSDVSGPPPAKVEQVGGSKVPSVVLTPVGAQRVGVQTTRVASGPSGDTDFPYSALVYEPDGTAAVYVNNGPLQYTRHLVNVDYISGNEVYVKSGVTAGMNVVTQGAEELLGAQNGVGEET